MNSFFIIEKTKDAEVNTLVLANGIHSPLEQREDLEIQLKKAGIRGQVVFDLLLSMGTKSRRYFISEFDGETLSPLRRAEKIPASFTEQSARALKQHCQSLDYTLLGKAMAFAVKQGYSF